MLKIHIFIIIGLLQSLSAGIDWDEDATSLSDCDYEPSDDDVTSLTITCNGLNLSDIPTSLPSDITLVLDLSNNELTALQNKVFIKFFRLSKLIVSYNDIKFVHKNAFANLTMLRSVDLSYNYLNSIDPDLFSHNPVLESVTLSGNPLVYVPEDSPFLVSSSIRSLNLRSCSLIGLYPATFSKLPSLYSLDLDSNNLQSISLDTLQILPELRRVKLGNNRWRCNCDIVDVMRWVSGRRGDLPAHEPIKCLDRGTFKTWWTAATDGKFCKKVVDAHLDEDTSGSTFELAVTASTKFTELPRSSRVVDPRTSPRSDDVHVHTSKPDDNTDVQSPSDNTEKNTDQVTNLSPNTEKSREVDWNYAITWNTNTVLLLIALPLTLGVAVFVSLMAVNYFTKRMDNNSDSQCEKQDRSNANASNLNQPLIVPNSENSYPNRTSEEYPNDHIYEELQHR